MCNKFLKLEHKKSSYALRMIMSEIGLHSFSTYIQIILSSYLCTRKDWQCHYKKRFLQKLHRWICAFCSHIDPCIVRLHFLRGMTLQFSTVTVRMHFFMFYMLICAYFGVRSMSIGVDFVLGSNEDLLYVKNET